MLKSDVIAGYTGFDCIKQHFDYRGIETNVRGDMIRLYRNAKFKQNLVIQGIKDVYSKFDTQRVAKEHEKLFEELVR